MVKFAGMFVVTSRKTVQDPSSSMPLQVRHAAEDFQAGHAQDDVVEGPRFVRDQAGELFEFDTRVELAPYLVGPVACVGGQPSMPIASPVDGGCSLDGRVEVVAA